MLSNTAVPIYYGQFREKVLSGEIPVNQEISMQMNRIDERIADPRYYYDDEAVNGYINFCENELTLTDGSDLHLLPTFKLWSEDVYGWYYFEKRQEYIPGPDGGHFEVRRKRKRLCRKQYLIIARGAAKSVYMATHQAYPLVCDRSTTMQVTTAPTMKQAEEVMSTIRTAITRSKGPLFKFFTKGSLQNTTGNRFERQKLVATKKGIENFLTGSLLEVRAMSIDKMQGMRDKYATVDEWLSGDVKENVIGAIEQGASKNEDYLIIAASSEGTVRNGVGDTIKMELMSILKGEYRDDHTSIWWYKLDDISEVSDPNMWIKAQPNIGATVKYDVYQKDVERAEKNPAVRNDILAKRFGLPLEGYTYFFTYEETIPHTPKTFWQMPCSMGADLSMGDDFCSFTFLFPLNNGAYGVKTRNYITTNTLNRLPLALRVKYDEFMREGSLFVFDGVTLDIPSVYEELQDFINENGYDVRTFGFDPYNAQSFVEAWIRENGEYGVEKVKQGHRTESVPLGELKHLSENRLLLFDQSIMQFCMGHAIALIDTNGNRKLYKQRADQKIDAVASMLDAWVAMKAYPDAFE